MITTFLFWTLNFSIPCADDQLFVVYSECNRQSLVQEDYIKEMCIGLKPTESESESEREIDGDGTLKNSVTVRKTRIQRNKEKAEKLKVGLL